VAILLHRRERRGCGGALRLFLGLLLETLVAGLMAPVVMLTQSIDVVAILVGRDSGWSAQRRDDGGIPARETRRLYRRHTVLGLLLGAVAWLVSLYLALWMLPVVLGLALAIPLALLTGRRWSGGGLLRTPEEAEPPSVVARAAVLQREWQAASPPGVAGLLREPRLLQAHMAMLPAQRRARVDPIDGTLALGRAKLDEAETLETALAALSPPELGAVLGDAATLRRLSELAGAA
jgi:membrane glycosyltransferase